MEFIFWRETERSLYVLDHGTAWVVNETTWLYEKSWKSEDVAELFSYL